MKLLINIVLTISIISCSTRTKFQPKDLVFTKEDFYRSPKKLLNKKEIEHDIDILVYAMESGYGAKGFLPDGQFEKAIDSLDEIKSFNELSEDELCEKVGDALWDIQDGHLIVSGRGKLCGKQKKWNEIKAQVGDNFAIKVIKEKKRPWHIERRKIDGKSVGLISITYFPSHKDDVWGNFFDEVKKLFKLDGIIIDLRGNSGGDDTTGFKLAEYLQDREVTPGWEKTIDLFTAETIALSMNNYNIKKLWLDKNKQPVPNYVNNFLNERKKLLDEIKEGKHPKNKVYSWNQADHPFGKNMFQGKIAILADRKCGSSGESTLEALAKHPNAKVYGENTAGKYHFGNVAKLILTHSKISVVLASKYNGYIDGRNIDKIGLAPDARVPKGTDALELALVDMFK